MKQGAPLKRTPFKSKAEDFRELMNRGTVLKRNGLLLPRKHVMKIAEREKVVVNVMSPRQHPFYKDYVSLKRKPMKASTAKKGPALIEIGGSQVYMWTKRGAHYEFSIWVRKRDGKCLRCGTEENLTNSHFHGRSHSATAFHPDNCDTLCLLCHAEWETEKGEGKEYWKWKIERMGAARFREMEILAAATHNEYDAIRDCMRFLAGEIID